MITVKEIRKANPQGKMTKVSGSNDILFDNGVKFSFDSWKQKQNAWNKLLRMGFEQHYNFSSDESDGIAEVGRLGENPFAFTMMCADPSRNIVSK